MVNNGELHVGPSDDPDRYQLWRRVGAGGEGEVWQGTRQLNDGPIGVAVKYYHGARFGLTESIDELSTKLETQAARLRQLHSPGLAAVHESFVGPPPHPIGQADASQSSAYFVMNYVDGIPLSEWAPTQPSIFRRLSVLDDAAGALDVLHRGGQVHADIKPSNLLVHTIDVPGSGEVPTAVLVDFGVMRAITTAQPSKVIGSHGFIAPELHQGGTYSPASDLYAFAMVCAGLVCQGQTSHDITESARAAGLPEDGINVLVAGIDPDPIQRNHELEHGIAGWLSRLRSGLTTTHTFAAPSTVIRPAEVQPAEDGSRTGQPSVKAEPIHDAVLDPEPDLAGRAPQTAPNPEASATTPIEASKRTDLQPASPSPLLSASPNGSNRTKGSSLLVGVLGVLLVGAGGIGAAIWLANNGSGDDDGPDQNTEAAGPTTTTTTPTENDDEQTGEEETPVAVTCPDGTEVLEAADCENEDTQAPDPPDPQPPTTIACPDGTTVAEGEECPLPGLLADVRSGNDFYLVTIGGVGRDADCSTPEDGSRHGDLLMGGAYQIRYDAAADGFITKGFNQNQAGCPWHDPGGAHNSVAGLPDDALNIWGFDNFVIDPSTGRVTRNNDLVGYVVVFP